MPVTPSSVPTVKRTRMSPAARREQLIALGLAMVRDRPLEEVSIDAVAGAAGVSRALPFHYFESKQDFHVAIARAQADEMLACTAPDLTLDDPIMMLTRSMSAFIDYVSENRKAYTAFMRGSSSADPAMREVFDQTRAVMAGRVIDHAPKLGIAVTPVVEMTVLGWISFVEETTISWLTDPVITRDQLLTLITDSLPALAAVVATLS